MTLRLVGWDLSGSAKIVKKIKGLRVSRDGESPGLKALLLERRFPGLKAGASTGKTNLLLPTQAKRGLELGTRLLRDRLIAVYLKQQKVLLERLRAALREKYQIDDANLVIEQPPDIKFGEYALPLAFELARRLKKAPKKIAGELVAELGSPNQLIEGFAGFEIAGAGYINARLDRGAAVAAIAADPEAVALTGARSLVEHTSINPNKAAHIGHLRNSVLGDTFVRLLRAAGQRVDVQNYIDNTGVQVADVVVGLMHLEKLDLDDVRELMASLAEQGVRIDFYCWDLYARVSQWYEAHDLEADAREAEKKARRQVRLDALHKLEEGGNDAAQVADLVATAVLRRHLETMQRLDIDYDFLPRESDILQLHFWDSAFDQMKAKAVLYFETEGKNKGCWVMKRAGSDAAKEAETQTLMMRIALAALIAPAARTKTRR